MQLQAVTEPSAQSFVADDGRTLLFSCEDFVARICQGDGCFVCGASPATHPFNDEHIVPRWILRRYRLFEKEITLPTGERRRYGGYRVPCCVACNTLLGERIETPVSEMLAGNFAGVSERLQSPTNKELIFKWLALLFLKVHLKDKVVPVHKDRRLGSSVISDLYDWADLHHIHAVARAPYTGAIVESMVLGSFFVVEVDDVTSADDWDFVDLTFAQAIAVRIGRVGIVAVLNDAGAAESAWSHRLKLIDGPISGSQFRELAAMFAVANDAILVRPSFGTLIIEGRWVVLFAKVPPELQMADFSSEKFGHALLFALGNTLSTIEVDGSRNPQVVAEKIASGRVRFLFDQNFQFRKPSDLIRREPRQ